MSEVEPHRSDDELALGRSFEEKGDFVKACEIYLRMLRQNAASVPAFGALAQAMERQGKRPQAAFILEQGLQRTANVDLRARLSKLFETWLDDTSLSPAEQFDLAARCCASLWSRKAALTLVRWAAPLKRHLQAVVALEKALSFTAQAESGLLQAMASLSLQGQDTVGAKRWIRALHDLDPQAPLPHGLLEALVRS